MKFFSLIPIFLIICGEVKSATLLEKSYEYVMNLGKSVAPNFMSIIDCMSEKEVWNCAREKAGKILDGWDEEVAQERKKWQEEADAEVKSSGRSFEEMPSKLGDEVETSLNSLVELAHQGMARALSSRKHHESGGIDTITISTGGDKKKMKKKKPKPPKIHLVHPMIMPLRKMEKEKGRNFPNGRQTWVIGDRIESSNFGEKGSSFGHDSSSFGYASSKGEENRPRALNDKNSDDSSSIGDLSIDLSRESSSRSNEDSYQDSASTENSSLSNESGDYSNEYNDYSHEKSTPSENSTPVGETAISDDQNSIPSDSSALSSVVGEQSSNFDEQSSNVGEQSSSIGVNEGRGVFSDLWRIGEEAIDAVAEHALETEAKDNGIQDKSSIAEQRGKKKKKKKAILKLLILGAVLKAKIGTLLQILSFKLQVKFFIVAVLGLAINLARLWIDLKNKHSQQPQKVIYYEHAQHQHHYDHEEEHDHGWGPWSRSMLPEDEADVQVDVDLQNSPYRAQERVHNFPRKYT